jgi:hypothetical protein
MTVNETFTHTKECELVRGGKKCTCGAWEKSTKKENPVAE